MGNNIDELALEELIAVEKDVVHVPCSRSSEKTRSKVGEGKLERLEIVAGDAIVGDSSISITSFPIGGPALSHWGSLRMYDQEIGTGLTHLTCCLVKLSMDCLARML